MNKRTLGRTGIEVSEVSFGAVEIGIPYGIGVRSEADMLGDADAIRLLRAALDAGINFYDTARFYGRSEELIGAAFKGRRDDVVICTKCALAPAAPVASDLRACIKESFERSLSALQMDYVDVYLVHDTRMLDSVLTAPVFQELKERGLARAIGVSTYTLEQTRGAIESGAWDVVQLAYNLMDQRQARLFPLAAEHGLGIMVRSALFKGILTDRGRNLHSELCSVEKHREGYNELLSPGAPTLYDLAVKFVLASRDISSMLLGIDRMEYLKKALAAADGPRLDERALDRARQLAYPDPEFLDLRLWDQKGWLR